jgi:hypothetical protein
VAPDVTPGTLYPREARNASIRRASGPAAMPAGAGSIGAFGNERPVETGSAVRAVGAGVVS